MMLTISNAKNLPPPEIEKELPEKAKVSHYYEHKDGSANTYAPANPLPNKTQDNDDKTKKDVADLPTLK